MWECVRVIITMMGTLFIYAGGCAEEADIAFSVMIYYMSLRHTSDEIEKGQVGCFGYQTG